MLTQTWYHIVEISQKIHNNLPLRLEITRGVTVREVTEKLAHQKPEGKKQGKAQMPPRRER